MITEEDCENAMHDAFSFEGEISFIYGDDKVGEIQDDEEILTAYTWLLTTEDKELLIEYAPKLFNTLEPADDLDVVCIELASMVGYYRMSIHKNNNRKKQNKLLSDTSRDMEESLKTHIKGVLNLIGDYRHPYKYDDRNPLIELLNKAHENPELFITKKKAEITPTKRPIEDYLKSLNLSGKSNVIRDFKTKISTISTPTFTYTS